MKLSTNIRIPSTGFLESERASQISSRLHHLGLIIPILIVYVSLSFYQIGHQSLWVDEVVSVQVASEQSFFSPVIWFRQSPLYFALLHVWAQLGTSDMFLRSLSVLFGGIAVCLTYMLALMLFNKRVAWIGTTILATSPFLIWYSQEVRYITLMIATSLLAMYTFHRVLCTEHRGWWLSYFLSLILAIASFKTNILLLPVQGIYLLSSSSHRSTLRKWLACQMVVFILFAWWINGGQYRELGNTWKGLIHDISVSSEPKSLSSGGHRDFELLAVPYTFFTFSTGFSMGPSIRELQVSRSIATLRPFAPLLVSLGILFCGLFISGLIGLWRQRDRAIFLIMWLALPVVGASFISTMTDMAYNVRYVSMALPAYILILAVGISAFHRPGIQIALLAAVLLVNAVSLGNYYSDPRYAREDARNAAQFLEGAAGPQDVILVVGNTGALRYYYKGNVPIVTWAKKANRDRSGISRRLTGLARNHERLWLVEIRPWEKDRTGNVKSGVKKLYSSVQHQHFPGVAIYAYDL